MTSIVVETFPTLEKYRCCRALFLAKQAQVDVYKEKAEVMPRLQQGHIQALAELGLGKFPIAEAEQTHGNQVALVSSTQSRVYSGVDALMTGLRKVCLKIFVADCAAVYLVDRLGRAIALVHSGSKGTALEIVPATIHALQKGFNISPRDLIAQISPCIRPPHYEIDFAADIIRQMRTMGVEEITDCGICTACHPEQYYSYRMDKGKTGRMAAILMLV